MNPCIAWLCIPQPSDHSGDTTEMFSLPTAILPACQTGLSPGCTVYEYAEVLTQKL